MSDFPYWATLRRLAVDRNEWNFLGESTWTGVMAGLASSFLPVLALRWGASPIELALLSGMPFVLYAFLSIPAGRFFERVSQRTTALAWSTLLTRANYLCIALIPWVLHSYQVWAMIAITTLSIIPASVKDVAIIAALGDLTKPERRSWVIGLRRAVISLTTAIATLFGGRMLILLPFPGNYQVILILAFIAAVVAVWHLSHLDYSGWSAPQIPAPSAAAPSANLFSLRYLLQQHPGFCFFSLGTFLFTGGYYMTVPLFPLYQVKTLGADESWIGLLATVQQVTMFVAYLLWARAGHRFSLGFVLGVNTSAWSLLALATALTTGLPQLLPLAVWNGVFWAGFNMGVYLGLLEVCPEARRPSFIGLYSAGSSVVGFICPLLGAQLVQMFDIHIALIGASLLCASGALIYLLSFPMHKPVYILEK
ncbi:MAG: MFS transporter [Chloroflexi bacterium]|nr:MFS transporter [Chloroflexota bacterium]